MWKLISKISNLKNIFSVNHPRRYHYWLGKFPKTLNNEFNDLNDFTFSQ